MAHLLEGFRPMLEQTARQQAVDDYCRMHTEPFRFPTDEVRQAAEEFADKLVADGKLMDYLEATAPEPCPNCGRV
jgi:hypothetical protein